jgi:hypothetical protein
MATTLCTPTTTTSNAIIGRFGGMEESRRELARFARESEIIEESVTILESKTRGARHGR